MSSTEQKFQLNSVTQAYRMFEHAEDDFVAEEILNKVIPALMEAERPLIGEADDYHNFSVAIIRRFDDHRVALDVIEMGLEAYPLNTDLLGDAIKYAENCAQPEKAAQFYTTLLTIDKSKWTWRSFSFSIDYQLSLYLEGESVELADVEALVSDYQANFPKREDAWKCMEEIFTKTNRLDKSIEVLKEAFGRFQLCPKCWLRYADLMVDEGNYQEAAIYIRKLTSNPISADSVNMAYVFYLDGLCMMTTWQHSEEYQNAGEEEDFDPKTVKAIYRRFRKAITHDDCRPSLENKIINLVRTIFQETGIPSGIEGADS